MTKIKFHGELANHFKDEYDLEVSSVSEAIHAIDMMSKGSIRKYFLNPQNKFKNYHLMVNGEKTFFPGFKNLQDSEVTITRGNLKSIDVIPSLEGAQLPVKDKIHNKPIKINILYIADYSFK